MNDAQATYNDLLMEAKPVKEDLDYIQGEVDKYEYRLKIVRDCKKKSSESEQ